MLLDRFINRRPMAVALVFFLIMTMFVVLTVMDHRQHVLEVKNEMQYEMSLLAMNAHVLIQTSVENGEAAVAYIQTHPDLDQKAFEDFVSKIIKDNQIIRQLVAIENTTIVFSCPLEGYESGIGVDLGQIDGQKEEIQKVKEERISLLVGPTELVEGGIALINRMPIYIGEQYWGQLSIIIKYNTLLNLAGIEELSKTYEIAISQIDALSDVRREIYNSGDKMKGQDITSVIDVPNGQWEITMSTDSVALSMESYLILGFGFVMAWLGAVLVRYMLVTNANLNDIVDHRTASIEAVNKELKHSIENLKATQDQLIYKEKMAAVGEMVAGVTHEVNTPLGVCVTANSYVIKVLQDLEGKLASGQIKKSELLSGMEKITDSANIIANNLQRASKLMRNFKKMSSEQHFEEVSVINMKDFMEYVTETISPAYKKTKHMVEVDIPENVVIRTYSGALTQVMTNLLMNSLDHGFEYVETGVVNIVVQQIDDTIHIDYFDNGKGIPEEHADKIFNPFFTTKREAGNTGLGMNIAFNIVHEQLKGSLQLMYNASAGVHFRIILPKEID